MDGYTLTIPLDPAQLAAIRSTYTLTIRIDPQSLVELRTAIHADLLPLFTAVGSGIDKHRAALDLRITEVLAGLASIAHRQIMQEDSMSALDDAVAAATKAVADLNASVDSMTTRVNSDLDGLRKQIADLQAAVAAGGVSQAIVDQVNAIATTAAEIRAKVEAEDMPNPAPGPNPEPVPNPNPAPPFPPMPPPMP